MTKQDLKHQLDCVMKDSSVQLELPQSDPRIILALQAILVHKVQRISKLVYLELTNHRLSKRNV